MLGTHIHTSHVSKILPIIIIRKKKKNKSQLDQPGDFFYFYGLVKSS